MEDQLDEELKNRIKKVFDDYDDSSADEGWLQLRKKFPAEDRRRILPLFWWSAAAILLLALGFGIWKYAGNNQAQNALVARRLKPAPPEKLAAQPAPKKVGQSPAPEAQNAAKHTAAEQTSNPVAATRTQLLPVIPFKPVTLSPALQTETTTQSSKTVIASTGTKTVPSDLKATQPPAKTADSSNTALYQTPQNQLAANQPNTQPAQPANGTNVTQPKKAASMFADNPVKTKKRDDGPRVRLGVYAASFVNYAKGSVNQTNGGAGFSAEIRIARNLKVVTGLTLAKNSLSYNGGIPTGAAQSNLFAPAAGIGSANPSYLSAASYSASAAVTVASVPAFQNYGVSMFNIDIPVNLKYDFNLKKTSFYLMAGLSSGTFANETYTYYYNYPALPSPSLQAPHSLSSQKSFDSFYFGKMLNVAFGYGYPIGRNHIILEPFLKYPLGGVGAQNIRLGTGGINLKLNFPTR
jgi:hypothetical protein